VRVEGGCDCAIAQDSKGSWIRVSSLMTNQECYITKFSKCYKRLLSLHACMFCLVCTLSEMYVKPINQRHETTFSFFFPDCPGMASVCNMIVICTGAKVSGPKFYDQFLINLRSVQVMRCMENLYFRAAVDFAIFSNRNQPANHLTQVLLMEHVVIKYAWGSWVSQDVLHDEREG